MADVLLEILKLTIPALILFIAIYTLASRFFKYKDDAAKLKAATKDRNISLPIRLQAYERLTLFLERISIENLLMRPDLTLSTAGQMQIALIQIIRAEFEHNLAQQIYVTEDAWQAVKHAKNQTIAFINQMAEATPDDSPSMDFRKNTLEVALAMEEPLTYRAINMLKDEVAQLF